MWSCIIASPWLSSTHYLYYIDDKSTLILTSIVSSPSSVSSLFYTNHRSSMALAQLVILSLVLARVLSADDLSYRDRKASRQAFVTMLYTIHGDMYVDGFEIGVRVLGQSLREVNTQYDYIVLCTDDVPLSVRRVLEEDGWIVKPIEKMKLGERFNENVLKLNIFKLTEYRRVVFLDADVIVTQNIDELFKCGSFCASFRHSDLFNSGIMVVKPSLLELNKIKKVMKNVTSNWFHKTYGDQVVLNYYFKDLKKATMFEPTVNHYEEKIMRLSTGYNADVGMYYLNDGWSFPKNDLKIIHYTFGIVKPMLWWTYPLFHLNWKWDELRGRLPSKLNEPSVIAFKHWLPPLILISLFISFRLCSNSYKLVYRQRIFTKLSVLLLPGKCGWFVVAFPFFIQILSLLFAFFTIPSIMRPRQAWWLYTMWSTFYMTLFYSLYCRYLFEAGESYGSRFISSQAARVETLIHSSIFVLLVLSVFYIPYFFSSSFWSTVIAFLLLMAILMIQGYVSGRRLLKIWFGHHTKTVAMLPCYKLQSPIN